jgi:hypothetical protein
VWLIESDSDKTATISLVSLLSFVLESANSETPSRVSLLGNKSVDLFPALYSLLLCFDITPPMVAAVQWWQRAL